MNKYVVIGLILLFVMCVISGCSEAYTRGREGFASPDVRLSPWSMSHPPEYTVPDSDPPYYYGGDEPVGTFPAYRDPVFPDIAMYNCQYWPRVGRLGTGLFEGWPPAPTAY